MPEGGRMLQVGADLTSIPGTVFLVEHLARKFPKSRAISPPPSGRFTEWWHDLLFPRLVSCFQMPAYSHGAYIGTLGLMECKKYVLYVIRKR